MRKSVMLFALVGMLMLFGQPVGWGEGAGTHALFLPLLHEAPAISPYNVTAGADGRSYAPDASGDGARVAFLSEAANLVPDDSNGLIDAFVWERESNHFRRVSVASDGSAANHGSMGVWLSSNGRYVLLVTFANNFAPNDRNDSPDLFRHDLQTGVTELVSLNPEGIPGGGVEKGAISADGSIIYFTASEAMTPEPLPEECVGIPPCTALYRRDMRAGVTTLVARTEGGLPAVPIREVFASDDGDTVVYAHYAVAGDGCSPEGCSTQYGQFIWRAVHSTGTTTLVARSEVWQIAHAYYDSRVALRGLSGDGATVAYASRSEGGSGSGGNAGRGLVMRRGTAEPVGLFSETLWTYPRSTEGSDLFPDGHFSSTWDGERVVFTASDLNTEQHFPRFPEDNNGTFDLFRRDSTRTLRLDSTVSERAEHPSLSNDGRILYYQALPIGESDFQQVDIFVAQLP